MSSARVAPSARACSIAVAKSRLRRSRCRRFLPVFDSGTRRKSIAKPAVVVRKAQVPTQADGPSTLRNTGLGLIVGLAIGLLLAFIRDSLDRRLRGSGDVHDELDLPVLGRISEDALGHAAAWPEL